MWRFVVISLCAVVVAVCGQSTPVSQCINHEGELPLNTHVEGCDQPPCVLPQLQDVVLHIVFKAPRTMRNMTTLVAAYLFGIGLPINYPLEQNSLTCNFLTNTYCPVMKDEVVQYTLRMYIEPFFPVGTQATLEFRVVDEQNVPAICIRVGIRVVAAVDNLAADSANNATIVVS